MKLLHVDSSILGDQSVSRRITASVVDRLRTVIAPLDVTYRDLAAAAPPHQSGPLLAATALSPDRQSSEAQRHLAVTSGILDEFLSADIVVIGAPMYNFGIPSQLKAWIDCLAVAGKTFRYTEAGVEGLAGGKRVIVGSARGGFYGPQSPVAALDHQEAFLRGFFGFIGVTDVTFVRAEGVMVSAEIKARALDAALAEAAALAA